MSGQGRNTRQGGNQRRQQGGTQQRQRGGGSGSPQQPQQGGGSGGTNTNFVTKTAIIGALGGVLLGVMMTVIGKFGGLPVLPGATDAARTMAATQQPGAGKVIDAGLSVTHHTIIAYMTTELAPLAAFGLAIVGGVLAMQLGDGANKTVSAAVGMFVGGFLLVVLSSAIVGFLGPSLQPVIDAASQVTGGSQIGAAAAVQTSLADPQWTNIGINGAIAGVGSALTAAATVFTLDNF